MSKNLYISYTSTFPVRTRCKVCLGPPRYVYREFRLGPTGIQALLRNHSIKLPYTVQVPHTNKEHFKLRQCSYQLENGLSTEQVRTGGKSVPLAFICECGASMWAGLDDSNQIASLRRACKGYVGIDLQEI